MTKKNLKSQIKKWNRDNDKADERDINLANARGRWERGITFDRRQDLEEGAEKERED